MGDWASGSSRGSTTATAWSSKPIRIPPMMPRPSPISHLMTATRTTAHLPPGAPASRKVSWATRRPTPSRRSSRRSSKSALRRSALTSRPPRLPGSSGSWRMTRGPTAPEGGSKVSTASPMVATTPSRRATASSSPTGGTRRAGTAPAATGTGTGRARVGCFSRRIRPRVWHPERVMAAPPPRLRGRRERTTWLSMRTGRPERSESEDGDTQYRHTQSPTAGRASKGAIGVAYPSPRRSSR
mmetsp:Transcript_29707/g.88141  ORF Transcript_29707/g.88141 Transcript_29707/m.88141 type:complete len:241 (+) Transcript_29707:170-892(+)